MSSGVLTQYKNHGFGFALGLDGGDPDDGWYGGAFTFFAGDTTESLPNDAKDQNEWYMLTGYTDWRGAHLFIDSQLSVGYGQLKGKRFLDITLPATSTSAATTLASREADGKRAGLLGSFGVTTGAVFNWGNTVLMPQLSIDGPPTMREEGFTRKPAAATATSICGNSRPIMPTRSRAVSSEADVRQDFDLGDFTLQPGRGSGYRFDFLNDPIKVKAAVHLHRDELHDHRTRSVARQCRGWPRFDRRKHRHVEHGPELRLGSAAPTAARPKSEPYPLLGRI